MKEYIQKIQVGAAEVSAIIVGANQGKLSEMLNAPKSEWYPNYRELFEQVQQSPTQCIYVKLPHTSLLVDAGVHIDDPEWPYAIPDYDPPPTLLEQLATINVQPETIEHVVITHTHLDHYNGLTLPRNGTDKLCFPNAKHYVGRADWERTDFQESLRDPTSIESKTLGVVKQKGLLMLLEGKHEISPEIQLIPTPSCSVGHQMVRIHSVGQTLYCIGDLYHGPVEVNHPTWQAEWTEDIEAGLESRRSLTEAAVEESAWLIAAHIRGIGRLERNRSGVVWTTV